MAIQCEFIDLIIPIDKIDEAYTGGFQKFKEDHIKEFSGRMYHDDFLFRDGAMNYIDINLLIKQWEALGLKGVAETDGKKEWVDFCVAEGMFGGPTLSCDWIEYDSKKNCVYLKGKPKGELKGPNRK